MGIERVIPAAGAAATPRLVLVGLTGETLLEEDYNETLDSADILKKVKGSTCFDKLLMDGSTVSGKIEVPKGAKQVTLTLVRVDMGLLSGIDEDMMKVVQDFGAVQDVPEALKLGSRDAKGASVQCLSMAKADGVRCSGGGFGHTDHFHHVMLLPDGRILAKYHYESDYMEKCGDYDCACKWEIAEGRFTPVKDEAGILEVEWTGWCELNHHTSEPFGPGTITGNWEAKVIDPAVKRGPSILVPTDMGKLSVPTLCEKWAKEGTGGIGCAPTKSVRVAKSEAMPKLSAEILTTMGMDPRHLAFWELV